MQPTMRDSYNTVLTMAVSMLKPEIDKHIKAGASVQELLKIAWKATFEKERHGFFMCPWRVDDDLRFRVGVSIVYLHYAKVDPEMADRLKRELQALQRLSVSMELGGVDLSDVLSGFEEEPPLGLLGLYREVRDQWVFDTETKPVIERGERELEKP